MEQFQVYADYGANYELVVRDIEETQQQIMTWPEFDRAIEILSATVNPVRTREENYKKALSVKDLLIKVRRTMYVKKCGILTPPKANPAIAKIRTVVQRFVQVDAGMRRSRSTCLNPGPSLATQHYLPHDEHGQRQSHTNTHAKGHLASGRPSQLLRPGTSIGFLAIARLCRVMRLLAHRVPESWVHQGQIRNVRTLRDDSVARNSGRGDG